MQARKILIIEDETSVRDMLGVYFQKHGFEVILAATTQEGFRHAMDSSVEVVLSDIALSDGDGLDLLTEIKAKKPELPIIIMTGMGQDDNLITEAKRKGASEYVSKKSALTDFVQAVNRVLAKS